MFLNILIVQFNGIYFNNNNNNNNCNIHITASFSQVQIVHIGLLISLRFSVGHTVIWPDCEIYFFHWLVINVMLATIRYN